MPRKEKSYQDREEPEIALVEAILGTAVGPMVIDQGSTQITAARGLWICACVTFQGGPTPTWLIYDTDDDGIGWCRVPDGVEETQVIDARLMFGGHAAPERVLFWLQGKAAIPFETETDDLGVIAELSELRRKFVPAST